MTYLKFWNWSKSPALLLQVSYNIEVAQHDREKHWSGEFSYRDSPSYGSSERNEEKGSFLSKTTTPYVLLAKQRSVFIPRQKEHSILVAFLAGV